MADRPAAVISARAPRRPALAGAWARHRRRDTITAYLFLLPSILGLILTLGSVVAALLISFTRWNLFTPPAWIGLGNYARMGVEPLFLTSLLNTVYYTVVSVPFSIALALSVAVLLNQPLRGRALYRAVYFMPVVSSSVAIAVVWGWLYAPDIGLIDYLLGLIGVQGPAWLGDSAWAMPAIILMTVWKGFGYNMVIFLAGLQNIAPELLEAAAIDGATRWQRFRRITLPLLSPTTFFVVVLSIISSFQVFDATYLLTQGGPANATRTLGLEIYDHAFQYYDMGYASSLAYVLFAIIFLFTLLQLRAQRRWVFYD